jgi:hypothetical protein
MKKTLENSPSISKEPNKKSLLNGRLFLLRCNLAKFDSSCPFSAKRNKYNREKRKADIDMRHGPENPEKNFIQGVIVVNTATFAEECVEATDVMVY